MRDSKSRHTPDFKALGSKGRQMNATGGATVAVTCQVASPVLDVNVAARTPQRTVTRDKGARTGCDKAPITVPANCKSCTRTTCRLPLLDMSYPLHPQLQLLTLRPPKSKRWNVWGWNYVFTLQKPALAAPIAAGTPTLCVCESERENTKRKSIPDIYNWFNN